MLQTIREHTQGWIAGVIISIIILTFALWGIHSYFVGGSNNSVVAEVNGTDITKEQLAVAYERLRRQAQLQGANNAVTAKDEIALKERALRALIDIEVLKQSSTAQGYRISNGQIDNYLQSMPEFQVDGRFSRDRFQEILASTLLSSNEFIDLIRTSLLLDQPKLGIIFTSFAVPSEIYYTIGLVNQVRDIDYINLPMQHFLAQPIEIPADKIKAYYEQHQSEFMTPEQVNVEYIELSLKELAAGFNPTETELKNFYNENINSYTQPMEWKLANIEIPLPANPSQDEMIAAKKKAEDMLKALSKGESFARMASQTSSRLKGNEWLTLNQVPTELQKAVASLTKPGQISDIVRTGKNLVILKVIDIKDPKIQAFETVKDKVKETYIHQHAEEKFAEKRDQLADLTYEHPDSLQYAAKTLDLPIKTSELFTKDKATNDISQYKKVRDTAFSNDVLNLQNNSDVIQLNPETVIVLHIKSHVTSTLLPLESISKQIGDKLKAEEAEMQAEKFAQTLRNKLAAGADPKEIASENKLTWTTTGNIGRYSTKVDSAILDLAFRLPNPDQAGNKTVYGMTRLPNGYAIVALKSVKNGEVANDKQYAVFAEQVQNSEGLLEYELYKLSQTSKASVKVEKQ